jgi:hypothetical protein
VQRERVVALAPVVADALAAVHDQGIDLPLRETGGHRQPGVPAADHQHRRIAVAVFAAGFAPVQPVRPGKIARVRLALRPQLAHLLLVSAELGERGEQRPRFLRLREKSQHAGARPFGGLEPEDGLDAFFAGPRRVARRGALPIEAESVRTGAHGLLEARHHGVGAAYGADIPCECQQVAPVAIGMKQIAQCRAVALAQGALELPQPVVDDGS